MYYFTILGLNLPGGVSEFLWVTRKLKGSSDSAKDCPGQVPDPEISPALISGNPLDPCTG